VVRYAILSIFLLPYLYYGTKDNIYHFVGRKVSLVEHLVHLFIGITLFAAIAQAYQARAIAFVIGIAIFLIAGAIDEYIYHRHLPEHESDLHAKGHLALLIFVVVAVGTIWLERHEWNISLAR
jgi:hypothetical protein